MEKKNNIAEILKDKSKGIRLYSPIFGECAFCLVREETDDICVKKHNGEIVFFDSKGLYNTLGEVMLFPSKEMRDWGKFAWKKGDVLVNEDGSVHIIFEKFEDDAYTMFSGRYYYSKDGKKAYSYFRECDDVITEEFTIETEDAAQTYISTIEERLGGKLNRETLEVEKSQPEFKDGDIVTCKMTCGSSAIILVKRISSRKVYFHVYIINGKVHTQETEKDFYGYVDGVKIATDSEKQQLFEALAKKGKRWDAEKKQIVDLMKPKAEFKPFDKVLVRDSKSDNWRANLFGYIDKDGYYRCVYANWVYCIPYEGNEHLLGTTKDVEG